MPFRDAEATLSDTLDSIASQTLDDFELIAVDDHSHDRSTEMLGSVGDNRFRLLRNNGNGLVDALNLGVESARSRLIARMDADDIMHPTRLERQVRYMDDHPDVGLLGCRVRKFPESIIRAGYRAYIAWQNDCCSYEQISNQIYVESPFAHPSVVFRKQTFTDLGGYHDGLFPEDYELWLRMYHAGIRMEKLPEILLDWRDSDDRLSRTSERYSREAFDRLRAQYLHRDSRLPKNRPLAFWGAGRKTRLRLKHLSTHGIRPDVWIDIDPRKIGNKLDRIPVLGPDTLDDRKQYFVLVCVTNHGARNEIGAALKEIGYREGEDYLAIG